MVNRDKAMSILQEEASLNEIVQLVGKDSLSAADQLTLETAKMLREDFLQQNGFMEVDWYSSYERQDKMIQMILDYDKLCRAAIEKAPPPPSCSPSLPGADGPGQERAGRPVRRRLRRYGPGDGGADRGHRRPGRC